MIRSSGPRTASTMQNSVAPWSCARFAASTSGGMSMKGSGRTGVGQCRDCEQNAQSSGQPPVFAEMIDSTSTSAPALSSRTW